MVQILREDFAHTKNGRIITPMLTDYIVIPRISQYGTTEIVNLLPLHTLAKLSHLRDSLAGVKRRKNETTAVRT